MAIYEKRLKEWVNNNLISESQAVAIRKYEATKPSSFLFGFVGLGAFIVGLGFISLIAANWKSIPVFLKLAVDFGILLGAAGLAIRFEKEQKPLWFEGTLVFILLFTLASIGLVAQIYQSGGPLYQAILFWAFLTSGIMVYSKKLLVPLLWVNGLFGAVGAFIYDSKWAEQLFDQRPFMLIYAIPFLAALAALISRYKLGDSPQTRSFRAYVALSGIIGLLMVESGSFVWPEKSNLVFQICASLMMLAIAGIWLIDEFSHFQKALLSITTLLYGFAFQWPFFVERAVYVSQRPLLIPTSTLLVMISFALFMASLGHKRLFRLFLQLIGLRFLFLYHQAFWGLTGTGVGLMISGALIIGSVTFWRKKRDSIEKWVEGLVK